MIVTTISALKALTCGGEADVLGYYTAGDGGGGRFYFDATSTATDDTGLVIAPTSGGGRWIRIRSDSAVSVDWFAAPSGDYTAAFTYASVYPNVVCSKKTYLMNAALTLSDGQFWSLNGAFIYHTDDTKPMFTGTGLTSGAIVGPGTLKGTLVSSGGAWNGEKGIVLNGCNGYRVQGVTTRLFMGQGFHIIPGTFAGFKADQSQITDCAALECQVGLQIDNGSGAEYNVSSNFNAIGNITGVKIGAGNNTLLGGNIVQNTTGVSLTGGSNNGHGIFSGTNINHNSINIRATDVSYGYTFNGCHIYGDGPVSDPITAAGRVILEGTTTDINFVGGVLDAAIINDAGTNRVSHTKKYAQFAVGQTVPNPYAQLIQADNF